MNCAVHTGVPATAYCRTCGKALCAECQRDVAGAIYCEPCIAARMGAAGTVPGAVPGAVPVSHGPNPVGAGLLGMIPGVGAMYNGQFVKALVFVIIFAVLVAAGNHTGPASDFFGVLSFFFWCYMVFDSYITAKARQEGKPSPDPLGIERLFGIQEQPLPATGPAAPGQPAASTPSAPSHEKPVGALLLIILGVLFLTMNLGHFYLHRWWPLILIGLGIWVAYKNSSIRVG